MKPISLPFLTIFTYVLLSSSPALGQQAPAIAIENVSIIDIATGSIGEHRRVLIEGNRITAISSAGSEPLLEATQVLDGSGKFLIPGMWDMHAHIGSDEMSRKSILPMFIAHGVTGLRILQGDCPEPCDAVDAPIAQIRQWQKDIESSRQIGPRMFSSSYIVGSSPADPRETDPWRPSTPDQAQAFVQMEAARGVNFIKVHNLVARDVYFALAAEAQKQQIGLVGHVPGAITATEASNAGQESIEHLFGVIEECTGGGKQIRDDLRVKLQGDVDLANAALQEMIRRYDARRCKGLFATFEANETWHVPTLIIYNHERVHTWPLDPKNQYVSAKLRDQWLQWQDWELAFFGKDPDSSKLRNLLGRIVFEMEQAGVGLLAGTDANWWGIYPGYSLHEELEQLVGAGLTPFQALRTATLNPAIYLNLQNEMGTVEVGKIADLVLLEGNPLDEIRNTRRIHAVVANGRLFTKADIEVLSSDVVNYVRDSGFSEASAH
ncbi:Amidohydrolase family protein [Microbulbifer donghaiensis]|uniref:Amidohydrolase family protein n=1 Tax=Microbulbifer donghaiensis TaxID=494016 RepID=A0A1M4UWD1_9GAMM|nr:amidohydrolase family protein [Microbulbifer donghaiensis]SHE61002.1 Amidohydrolase family protein [Microbulbifer donghaiensis]